MSETKLTLRYFPYRKGIAYGNLMFEKSFPMKRGRFPKDHPFAPECNMDNYPSIGEGDKLKALRELGYYISCFPEGDGMCFSPAASKTEEQVIEDICKTLNVVLTEVK